MTKRQSFTCKLSSNGTDEEVWLTTPKIGGKQFTFNLKRIAAISKDAFLIDLCVRVQGNLPDESLYTCVARLCPECYANLDQKAHKKYCSRSQNN